MDLNTNEQVQAPVDLNAEAKAALEAAGVSAAMAAFLYDELKNKTLNSEGIEVGDKITIVGMADEPDCFVLTDDSGKPITDDNGQTVTRPYASVITTGDRDTISLGRLVGTPKEKYFESGRNAERMDYDPAKVVKFPRRAAEAALKVLELKGHTLQLVEIAENCGRDADRTYYRFIEV